MLEIASFYDDESISGDELLYRRIRPDVIHWEHADEHGVPPVPHQGLQDVPADRAKAEYGLPGACLSIGLYSILADHGKTAHDYVEEYESHGVVSMAARAVRELRGPAGEDWKQE